jgi:L-2,4-diaminobutyric acid acetyltransferase
LTLKNVEDTLESNVNSHQFDALPAVKFRSPSVLDGNAVTALIKNSPPLDTNSAYCNLLQCSHFAQTCVVAESNNHLLAWLSAYIPPEQQDHVFIWQVAVHSEARGQGLAKHLLSALLKRKALAKVQYLITTITQENQASWSLFEGFAKSHQLHLSKTPHFEKERHFQGVHETEFLVKIGPFNITEV